MAYTPDTHDTSHDPGSRDLLGQGRTIPASHSLGDCLDLPARTLRCGELVGAFVRAIEIRERYCRRHVVLDETAVATLIHGDTPREVAEALLDCLVPALDAAPEAKKPKDLVYKTHRVLRVHGTALERLLEVRQAIMHGYPVVVGYKMAEGEHGVGVVVGYAADGSFEVSSGSQGEVSSHPGEWLMEDGVDLVIVDGSSQAPQKEVPPPSVRPALAAKQ
jgi:hypothetical protein